MSDDKEEQEAIICKIRPMVHGDHEGPMIVGQETEMVLRPKFRKSYGLALVKNEKEEVEK